ncbi:hypothetical protein LCGC14_2263680 [marine sediment metagenome]|uniref:Uncharacterized protein n=1 Tax=marine sediment metagenome TaxID=412755 RepID=A0A0F9FBB4_9ZZZZ
MLYSPEICKEAKEKPYLWGLPNEAKKWTLKAIKKVLEETDVPDAILCMARKPIKDTVCPTCGGYCAEHLGLYYCHEEFCKQQPFKEGGKK